jgi:hypothetical protein
MPGRQVLRYAVVLGDDTDAAYAAADEAFTPLLTRYAKGGGTRAARGSALNVDGAEVSAVVREGGVLTIRLFNPSDEPATVTIDGRRGHLVDLRGNLVDHFEGSFVLPPWRIATARIAEE